MENDFRETKDGFSVARHFRFFTIGKMWALNISRKLCSMNKEEILKKAYDLFNARKADELLLLMMPGVHWPNGWEGGYVNGREEVKAYWLRQWKEVDPEVVPEAFYRLVDGKTEVTVRQTVKDLNGSLLFNGRVKHIYSFEGDLVSEMQIEAVE